MDEIWKRIEAWLAGNAPEILSDLQPPAGPDDLEKVNKAIGRQLPDQVVASYRTHNGSRGGAAPLMGEWRLLPLDRVLEKWRELNALDEKQKAGADEFEDEGETEPDPGIQAGWWHSGWAPLASNSSGDFICVDLDPAPGGQVGQIISYLHAENRRQRVADDFAKWLGRFADDLEGGVYKVSDGWLERASD